MGAERIQDGEFAGTERYEVRDRIGAGGMGVVYRVRDRERDCDVALKLLPNVDPLAIYRFKREFRALADVSHANLVTLYELASHGDRWFFTMELIDGVSFLRHVRGAGERAPTPASQAATVSAVGNPRADAQAIIATRTVDTTHLTGDELGAPDERTVSAPKDLEALRETMRQLVVGVHALHQSGRLHRDLKPSNVLVDGQGRVVILDFGVVTELAPHAQSETEMLGTPAYMAPELLGGETVGPASDWYSVGIMLYEALTGRRPFIGRASDVLSLRQHRSPRRPRTLLPSLPDDLDRLCADLLARDPTARPSGEEILRRLGATDHGDDKRTERPISEPVAALVGREPHFEALRAAFERAAAGELELVRVHGDSGMGKSALVARFLAERRARSDATILAGRCYERESVPYKAVDSLLDALTRHLLSLPDPQLRSLLPPNVAALARLFPVLRRVDVLGQAAAGSVETPDPLELRRRAFHGLRVLLRRMAERCPLIIYIDDLHWGDSESAGLLNEVLRQPDAPPLLAIGSYRSDDAATSPFLRTFLAEQHRFVDVPIEPLSFDHACVLAHSLLPEARRGVVESVALESGGNPFFVSELVNHVKLDERRDAKTSARALSLEQVLRERWQQLDADAQRLLEVIAVAGRPVPLDVVSSAAGASGDIARLVAVLRAGKLVRSRGVRESDTLEAYHDRIRETVVADLPPQVLRDHHHALAQIFDRTGHGDAETIAVHYEGAEDAERAAHFYGLAAEKSSDAFAFDRAASLWSRVLALSDVGDEARGALQARLGEALANAGRSAEAASAYRDAASTANEKDALEYRRRAAEQLLRAGSIDEGMEALREVLGSMDMKLPATPRRALASLLLNRGRVRLRGFRFTERHASELDPGQLDRMRVCWTAALGLPTIDTITAADFQARHLLMALDAGEPGIISNSLCLEAALVATEGTQKRARTLEILGLARDLAERVGAPEVKVWVGAVTGLAHYFWSEWTRAQELLDDAERVVRDQCTGMVWEMTCIQYYSLWARFYLGDIRELARRVPLLVREAEDRGDHYAAWGFRTGWSNLRWLVLDDVSGARDAIEEALRSASSRKHFHVQHMENLIARANAFLYEGDGVAAWNDVCDNWNPMRRSMHLRVQLARVVLLHFRARAALAAAISGGERDAMLKRAARDARRIASEDVACADPLAQLIRGGIDAVRRDSDSAVRRLQIAERKFSEGSMKLYAVVARRRRGQTLGGAEGDRLVIEADAWMADQGIVRPDRIAATLAPGWP